jgi:histidine triad (HIT) family protein
MPCLFCKFATGEISTPILKSSDQVFAIADLSPQAPIHILLLPKIHLENAAELAIRAPSTLVEMFTMAAEFAKELKIEGYRMVFNTGESAGQSFFHAHLHLLGGRPFAWPPG